MKLQLICTLHYPCNAKRLYTQVGNPVNKLITPPGQTQQPDVHNVIKCHQMMINHLAGDILHMTSQAGLLLLLSYIKCVRLL